MGLNSQIYGLRLVTYFLLITSTASEFNECIPLVKDNNPTGMDENCSIDSECCEYPGNQGVRCEERVWNHGKFCYVGYSIGMSCTNKQDCTSQLCVNGFCKLRHGELGHDPDRTRKPTCPLMTKVVNIIDIVDGGLSTCACDRTRTNINDITKGILFKHNVGYTNLYSVGMNGIIIEPENDLPFEALEFCPSQDGPQDDPTCYSIEARSEANSAYIPIQSGTLFPDMNRVDCQKIHIKGRQGWYRYKILLGCRRNSHEDTCTEGCGATCTALQNVVNPMPDCQWVTTTQFNPLVLESDYPVYESNTGETVYLYKYSNTDSIAKNILMLQFDGTCCLEVSSIYYYNKLDVKVTIQPYATHTFAETYFTASCMEGIMVSYDSSQITTYYIEYRLIGEFLSTTTVNYSMTSYKSGNIEFGKVSGPSCTCAASNLRLRLGKEEISRRLSSHSCKGDYPIKIASVSLEGKCNKGGAFSTEGTSTVRIM